MVRARRCTATAAAVVVAAASSSSFVAPAGALVNTSRISADLGQPELYSTNAACTKRRCLNPVFPGLQGLALMEGVALQCQSRTAALPHMQFCKAAVTYNVALPQMNASETLAQAVRQQEVEAVKAYRYHLAAMNVDAWEHRQPELSRDDCVRSIWLMVCSTYFPKAESGCQAGQGTALLKPCRNACENYIQACGVECCDESVKCVFDRPTPISTASFIGADVAVTNGYANELGPARTCTGAARRRAGAPGAAALLVAAAAGLLPQASAPSGSWRRALLAAAVAATSAASLQGCSVIGHPTAAWEEKASYLTKFQFVPLRPEEKQNSTWQLPESESVLNSCSLAGLPAEQRCSGHGVCQVWNETANPELFHVAPLAFCRCDRDWADPECRTRRKSQRKAFFLSVFTGLLGGDRFYLEQYYVGFLKMVSLGGLGAWWIFDLVYIGSAPVYAQNYRLAADLPHVAFVMTAVGLFAALGVLVLNVYGTEARQKRQVSKMLLQAEEEYFKTRNAPVSGNVDGLYGGTPGSFYGTMAPS